MTQNTTAARRPALAFRLQGHEPVRSVALVAVFAALIVVAAIVPGIPVGSLGVPITLQTLAVMLAGLSLGAVRGSLAVLLYLALGFAGLPVFSGGRSGLQVMTTPSAGYLVAFAVAAFVVGLAAQQILARTRASRRVPLFFIAAMSTSILFVHTLGVAGMAVVADIPLSAAFQADLAFYPGDIVKNVLAAIAAAAVHRAFPDILARRVR